MYAPTSTEASSAKEAFRRIPIETESDSRFRFRIAAGRFLETDLLLQRSTSMANASRNGGRGRRRFRRGAVLVEFVVASVPLLLTFFSLVQLGKVMTAQMVFHHAANVAARAAAVIVEPSRNPNATGKTEEVRMAALLALGDYVKSIRGVKTVISVGESPQNVVRVELSGKYVCDVPLGRVVVCGADQIHDFKPVTSTLPLFGARYKK
jgi:TadE-like protein